MTILFVIVCILLGISTFLNWAFYQGMQDLARKLQAEKRARMLDRIALAAAVLVPVILQRFFGNNDYSEE